MYIYILYIIGYKVGPPIGSKGSHNSTYRGNVPQLPIYFWQFAGVIAPVTTRKGPPRVFFVMFFFLKTATKLHYTLSH